MTGSEFRTWLEEQATKAEYPELAAYIRGILAAADLPSIPMPPGAPFEQVTPRDLGDESVQRRIIAEIDTERNRLAREAGES